MTQPIYPFVYTSRDCTGSEQ